MGSDTNEVKSSSIGKILNSLDSATKKNVEKKDESAVSIFQGLLKCYTNDVTSVGGSLEKKFLEKKGDITSQSLFDLIDDKYDLDDSANQEILKTIESISSLDGKNDLSLNDFGLYETADKLASKFTKTAQGNFSADKIASILSETYKKNGSLDAESVKAALQAAGLNTVKDLGNIKDIINEVAGGDGSVSADDLASLAKNAFNEYIDEEVRSDVINPRNVYDGSEGEIPSEFKGDLVSKKLGKDSNGNFYVIIENFDDGKEDNLGTIASVVSKIYGVTPQDEDYIPIANAIKAKNPQILNSQDGYSILHGVPMGLPSAEEIQAVKDGKEISKYVAGNPVDYSGKKNSEALDGILDNIKNKNMKDVAKQLYDLFDDLPEAEIADLLNSKDMPGILTGQLSKDQLKELMSELANLNYDTNTLAKQYDFNWVNSTKKLADRGKSTEFVNEIGKEVIDTNEKSNTKYYVAKIMSFCDNDVNKFIEYLDKHSQLKGERNEIIRVAFGMFNGADRATLLKAKTK